MYKYEIVREEIISGSLADFRALMHEIFELQSEFSNHELFLQGERTPSDYPENRARWEITLGGTLHQRGFILARQLHDGTTKLQFAYYSKFQPIGPKFDMEFANYILGQSPLGNLLNKNPGAAIEKTRQSSNQKVMLRLVVVSPNDVQKERNIVTDVVEYLNHGIAALQGFYLEVIRWETDSHPGFHSAGPQGLIDEILDIENSDIVIGIFWKRFGTPVLDANSGTEHELHRAWDAWKKSKRPQVMVYFCTKPYSPTSKNETDQWGAVLEFQETFPKEGLWWSYRDKREFEKLLRGHLTRFLMRYKVESYAVHRSEKEFDKLGADLGRHSKPPVVIEKQWFKSKAEIFMATHLIATAAATGEKPPFQSISRELKSLDSIKIDPSSYEMVKNRVIFKIKARANDSSPTQMVNIWVGAWKHQALLEEMLREGLREVKQESKNGEMDGREKHQPNRTTTLQISKETKAVFSSDPDAIKDTIDE